MKKCTTIRFNWQPSTDKDYASSYEEIHVGVNTVVKIIDENEMPRPYYEVVYENGSRERYYNVYYAAFSPIS